MTSSSFKDLKVWQKAHEFVLNIYKQTQGFPKDELFGLTSQFRRAAVSIAANIAEGYTRKGEKDKLRFYNIAQGSLEECRYYLILTKDLGYSNTEQMQIQLDEVGRLLAGYANAIKK